eukprot:scaffold853_cov21-Tisochrysis_lutea.AAC.3
MGRRCHREGQECRGRSVEHGLSQKCPLSPHCHLTTVKQAQCAALRCCCLEGMCILHGQMQRVVHVSRAHARELCWSLPSFERILQFACANAVCSACQPCSCQRALLVTLSLFADDAEFHCLLRCALLLASCVGQIIACR